MKPTRVMLLSLGHLVVDLYPPFLAALLPILLERLDMSLTLGGLLASILMVSSSLSQPLFGILSDRVGGRSFLFFGPLMAALGMSFIVLLPTYGLMAVFLVIGGLGVSCYHPQAAALAGRFSGSRKGLGLSLFMVGGNVGYGVGPMFILALVLGLGERWSWVALVPAVVFVFILLRYFPEPERTETPLLVEEGAPAPPHSPRKTAFVLLWLVVWLRSTATLGLATFLPTFQTLRGLSLVQGGGSYAVFIISGALGSLVGGGLSDRIGRKNMVILSLMLVIPAFYGFLHSSLRWTYLFLSFLGFSSFLGESPCIVMAQEAAPGRGGTMSGLIMGFAWGMAGLMLVGIGRLADAFSMEAAIGVLWYLPIVGLVLAFVLPRRMGYRGLTLSRAQVRGYQRSEPR